MNAMITNATTRINVVSSRTAKQIAREGNKLTIHQGNPDNKAEMLPESQTDFFMIEQPYTTFSFVKDETGQLYMVRKVEGREASRVKKIK